MNHRAGCVTMASLAVAAVLLVGCGVLTLHRTTFSNQALGGEGQGYTLDDIHKIVDDAGLTDEQKREALRELGIEDEDLLDALLTLPPAG